MSFAEKRITAEDRVERRAGLACTYTAVMRIPDVTYLHRVYRVLGLIPGGMKGDGTVFVF